jgi:prepilin-type N-terminal cleavage/methylation domain-containing protein
MKRQGDKVTSKQGDALAELSRALTASPLHPRSRLPATRRAFTLPEVLASLVLIGIVLPVVMRGVSLALAATDDARQRVEAAGLAEAKLTELVAAATSNQGSATSGDFGPEHQGFIWTTQSSTVETDLEEIRVRVAWTRQGHERGVDVAGYAYLNTGAAASAGPIGTQSTSGGSTGRAGTGTGGGTEGGGK